MPQARDSAIFLRALPKQGIDLTEVSFPTVDSGGCVTVRTESLLDTVAAGHVGTDETVSGLCRDLEPKASA